ncbi:ANTAR domain-containing protein [Arthrobacter pigmenti]
MTDEVSVTEELQDAVLDSDDVGRFLNELVQLACRQIGQATHHEVFCAVTLLRPRRSITVASSNDEARRVDEVQYNFDDGPCLRAARERHTVHVPDFHQEERFAEYRAAVEEHGVRSALGVPIILMGGANAAIDVYCREPNAFSDDVVAQAETFAAEASKSLKLAVRMANLSETSKDLKAALESRTVIDLAAGVIMAQNRCSQQEAIDILKSASNARNMKMHAIAQAVLDSVGASEPTTHFER